MAKSGRDKIKLESTAGTGHFYAATKNKRTKPENVDHGVRFQGAQARRVQGNKIK